MIRIHTDVGTHAEHALKAVALGLHRLRQQACGFHFLVQSNCVDVIAVGP
jgi:hypothetical protein